MKTTLFLPITTKTTQHLFGVALIISLLLMWTVNQHAERSLSNTASMYNILLLNRRHQYSSSNSSSINSRSNSSSQHPLVVVLKPSTPTIIFPSFTNSNTNSNSNWLVGEVTRGRLGNNMFQYGSAYGVFRAQQKMNSNHNTTDTISFCVADRKRPKFRDLNRFYQGPFAPICKEDLGMTTTSLSSSLLELNETGYGTYTNFTIPTKCSNTICATVIREYLISFRYFHHVKPEMKHIFELKGRAKKRQRDEVLRQMSRRRTNGTKNVMLVGIHVRRTDIARDKAYRNPPTNYYQRAMGYFRTKYNSETQIVKFIIASDDKAWCARQPMFQTDNNNNNNNNNSNNNKAILIIPNTYDPVTEMSVLSHCHHVILSIGTFGWWAAYLAGGDVIYWNHVFDMNHQKHKNVLNLSDYYPPNWIGLD